METKEQMAKEYAESIAQFEDRKRYCEEDFKAGWDAALKSQWISIKKELPKEWEDVFMIYLEKKFVRVVKALYVGGGTWAFNRDMMIIKNKNVLAWMPIPTFDLKLGDNKDVLK